MATSAVQSAAQQLGRLLVEEAKFLYGVEEQVEELQQELVWMEGFLQDIDKRQHNDKLIRMWVSQVRDLAYEAEDIVEKFVHGVSHHGKDGILGAVTKISCMPCNARTLHEVGSDIETLTRKMSKLNKRLKTYGVNISRIEESQSQYTAKIRELRQTYCESDDKDFVTGDNNVQEMADQVVSPERSVVGIVGMGGLGKTTLARKVYKNPEVRKQFEGFAWVYVSQQVQRKRVLEETLRGLMPEVDVSKIKEDELEEKVRKVLEEKRCLVLLDDIWDEASWRVLKHAFSTVKGSESTLLLTTRNERVVEEVDENALVLKPKTLNEEDSWVLLRKKAFPSGNHAEAEDEMKTLAQSMLKQYCHGLPIAIVALGGVLATRSTVDEWKAVEKNAGIYMFNAPGQQSSCMGVMQVLELSYNDLPYYLKPCFLCLGNFPEDAEIPTDMLYQIWQAEGLVRAPEDESDDMTIYEIGEQYLNELIRRCIVQKGELYSSGRIKTCRVHDLIRDMCLRKGKEGNFLEVVDQDNLIRKSKGKMQKSRRAAINLGDKELTPTSEIQLKVDAQLRSLFINGGGDSEFALTKLLPDARKVIRMLRILHLDEVKILNLASDVQRCVHLRYLRLWLGKRTKKIPSFVWNLVYLETLDLRWNRHGAWIPKELWMLKRLVHLYLNEGYRTKGKLCLRHPGQMNTLVNVRVGDLHVDQMRQMTNLRYISFNLGYISLIDGEGFKVLVNTVITSPRLLHIPTIRILWISSEAINNDPRILDINPKIVIKRVVIRGVINQSILGDIVFPTTMLELQLEGSQIDGRHISDLQIPQLRELDIMAGAITGTKIVFSATSFPELRQLELWDHDELEVLEVDEGGLSKISHLEIIKCKKLNARPDVLPHGCFISKSGLSG